MILSPRRKDAKLIHWMSISFSSPNGLIPQQAHMDKESIQMSTWISHLRPLEKDSK